MARPYNFKQWHTNGGVALLARYPPVVAWHCLERVHTMRIAPCHSSKQIQEQVDALAAWSERIADMATKTRTIQNNGKVIEQSATELKADLDQRVAAVLKVLCRCGTG